MADNNLDQTILQALQWRYAVKTFDATKKISEKDFKILTESLRLAPSSYGLQPWKFFVVKNAGVRAQLREAAYNQSQVTDASHLVVFATMNKFETSFVENYVDHIAKTRGVDKATLDGYKKVMIGDVVNGPRSANIQPWTQRQAYIAMGFLLETAALIHVDACPMEGIDAAKFDKILKLEGTGYASVATVALGYRSEKDFLAKAKKVRFDHENVVHTID